MAIKTIPLSRLETSLKETLNECADSGQAIVVKLPDQRLVAIQPLEPPDDEALTNDLLESNADFRDMIAKSKAGPRTPFKPKK